MKKKKEMMEKNIFITLAKEEFLRHDTKEK